MTNALRIERHSGSELERYIAELAHLRITVFREFPYLYDGDTDYESRYLRTYIESPGSVIVLVLDGERVVGASTGLPLAHETVEFRQPFVDHGYPLERVFYFGESVLLPEYRGRGLGVRFFEEREAHVRELGAIRRQAFEWTTFCAVARPADHPRRPANYLPLDAFWERRGYTRHPELRTDYVWQDLDETEPSPKPMVFWLKHLTDQPSISRRPR